MFIRVLTELDAKEFWDLRLRALKEYPEAFGASYEEDIKIPMDKLISRFGTNFIVPKKENFILGAFTDNNDMVGVVGFRRETRMKLRHKGSVWGMYVVPELHQSGIGKLLLSKLIDNAKSLEGLRQIHLAVVSNNIKAKGLYASLGFESYGIEKNALKVGEQYFDEDLMVIFL